MGMLLILKVNRNWIFLQRHCFKRVAN